MKALLAPPSPRPETNGGRFPGRRPAAPCPAPAPGASAGSCPSEAHAGTGRDLLAHLAASTRLLLHLGPPRGPLNPSLTELTLAWFMGVMKSPPQVARPGALAGPRGALLFL